MRKSIIISFLLIYLANSYIAAAAEPTIEQLFKNALDAEGQAYIDVRQKILNLSPQNDSFLKEQAKSTDLQTRIIAQAILERAAKSQEYRHFEELMIVPITVAAKYGRNFRRLVNPFDTIKEITQIPKTSRSLENRRTTIDAWVGTPSQINYHSYCHDDSAFLFMAEMAMKDTMLDLPELSEQVEWTDSQKTYTLNARAEMLGVLPQTAEKWHQTGIFLVQLDDHRIFIPMQTDSNDLPDSITQFQIRNFYEYFSDKIINPEYLESIEPVSRVVHADAIDAAERFQQDPGSLSRCYAVLMLRNFAKPETPELLYKIYKDDISEYVRLYCVEGFSAQNQVEQIREAMKDYSLVVESDDSETTDTPVEEKTTKVPCALVRNMAVIKSQENPEAFTVSDYIETITFKGDYRSGELNNKIIQILVDRKDIAAIDPLIKMFCYSSYYQESVIKAINEIDPNSMYKLLDHDNAGTRKEAWSKFVSLDLDFPLEKDYLVKNLNACKIYDSDMILTIMSLIAKNYPDSLFGFMEHKVPMVRNHALGILVSDPEKYLPKESLPIKELLLSYVNDPEVRLTVLNALSKYSSDDKVYALFLDALKDTNPSYRIAAIGNLKDSAETISILDAVLMQEKDSDVRFYIIEYLCKSKEPSKYEILVKFVRDENIGIRRIVADSISKWEDNQAIELLKLLINDPDSQVQRTAVVTIAQRNIGLLSELIPGMGPKLRQIAYSSLVNEQSDKIVQLLIKGTQDENVEVQKAALWNLTRQKFSKELEDPIVLVVRKCLTDNEPEIRNRAIYCLYNMLGDKSFEIISGYLYDPDTSVKITAIGTLMRFDNPEILKYLMEALAKEEDKETLVELVRALQTITGNLLTKNEWLQWWSENKDTYLKTEK